MKIVNFLRDMLGTRSTINISMDHADSSCTSIAIDVFTFQVAVNFIASCISKCEFKTFNKYKEVKKDDYYKWNVESNVNQNSKEFIKKLIYKLLTRNEALVIKVNGQYFVADDFCRKEYAINEDYFESVTVKDLTFNKRFNMSEVLYYKYNNQDVKNYINKLMYDYNELLILAKGKYRRAGGRKGIIHKDTILKGNKEEKEAVEKMIEEGFKKYFESENATVSIPKGMEYQEQNGEGNKKSANELKDIIELINISFKNVCQALNIPPALLKGETANIQDLMNNLMSFCITPITSVIEAENNRKLYGKEILNGTYMVVDTSNIIYKDIFAIAEKIDKIIASGVTSIDEIRAKLKMPLLNTEWSRKHWITKNYQDINFNEGGINSE